MRLLVTGGAGYIGSQVVFDLLQAGHRVVVVDNLSTGHAEAIHRAEGLAGRACRLIHGDISDIPLMIEALNGIDVVIHLAASKLVGESMEEPESYFYNNLGGMTALFQAMQVAGVQRIVYSSSAAVYGNQLKIPITEDSPLNPESPYGLSKLHGEQLLAWMARCRGWAAVSLRYFNPVGAHPSGLIGQPPESAAALVPRALKALLEPNSPLTVFGTDYPTPDGTGLRDYIHICDLSRAHLAALSVMIKPGHRLFNVGTGRPYSVLEVLETCKKITGKEVPVEFGQRRPGDLACASADPSRFEESSGFKATLGLEEMVSSAWKWHTMNPTGYQAPVLSITGRARPLRLVVPRELKALPRTG
jgi:UDP-glucose 4-epimerase